MKINKIHRLTAAALAILCVLPQAAQAAAPTIQTDEAVYINLDYYGTPENTRIVKGVSLNGHTEFTDYGNYSDVYNMSTLDEPTLGEGEVSWALTDDSLQRFYFECVPDSSTSIQLPWNFDVSYKLNGVPVEAEKCAGASGLIEMNIHAVPNDAAGEYYKNNMMLVCATGIDMSKMLSIDAPGAQVQSIGTYKIVMFMGLPGEESTFTVRIGANEFESMGLVLFMAPATLSSLDILSDMRDIKDRLGSSGDSLYEGLSSMLNSMQSMQSGLGALSSGISGINSVRQQLMADRGTIDPQIDTALSSLEMLAGKTDSLIPELNSMKTTLTTLSATINSMLGTIQTSSEDIRDYQQLLKDLNTTLGNLDDLVEDLQDTSGDNLLRIHQLQSTVEKVKQDLKTLQTHLSTLREKADALSGQIADLQKILDSASLSEPLRSLLSSLLESANRSLSTVKQSIRALEDLISDSSGLLGTSDAILDDLEEMCDVLEDYNGLPQDLIGEGKDLTVLADRTLERVHQLIADVPALSASLDEMTENATSAADKCNELFTALTKTLTSANDLLQTATDNLRAMRDKSDASLQTSLNGLIDVLDRASASGSSSSLQNANDSIHGAISDAEKDLEEDTNVLNIDAEAALQSVTSSQNPTPASLQFILRTQEISAPSEEASAASDDADADVGVFARIGNIFKKLFSAVYGVFASDEA
ncbi:hypothetical protein [Agathobaculum sp. Marseille-P7918]|uniref:hypothetical protein n=1 Tax=Agathobaculum sp. Marseille-P7918 TaxID=2479843 RepID=UPI000F62D62C|nr:hypothetical protein [Agathobaculum sp. Marseille-P7918]